MESGKDINIRDLCELCKSLPCCPEHCCDVILLLQTSYHTSFVFIFKIIYSDV